MKALLVYLRSPQHYSIWNPLSIESLIGHIKKVVPEVEIDGLDINGESQIEQLQMIYMEYDIIGFSISSYTLEVYKEIIKTMSLCHKKVILGNQLPTYLPNDLFQLTIEDSDVQAINLFISVGEGEITLEKLLKKILQSDTNYDDIQNLVYYKEGQLITNEIISLDLSLLKYPPSYMADKEEVMQLQLSRGCYWGNCAFCTRLSFRNGKRWQSFPIVRIKQDLYNTIINMGVQSIEFCDDEFFGGRTEDKLQRALEISSYINELAIKRQQPVQFRIFTRPDFIYNKKDIKTNEEVKVVLKKMKEYGLTRIYMGIESGCDSQLKRYNRGIDVVMVEAAIAALKEIDLKFDSGFILFDPGLCIHEICDNIKFYRKNGLIETNQWFWRPMIANVGSTIGNKFLDQGKAYNVNSMSVDYDFSDPSVEHISKIIDVISAKTKDIFYALKSVSKKDYDYSDKEKYNYLAHSFVEKNGLIYVDLLEHIAQALVDAEDEVNALVDQVESCCFDGRFEEDDANELMDKIEKYNKYVRC